MDPAYAVMMARKKTFKVDKLLQRSCFFFFALDIRLELAKEQTASGQSMLWMMQLLIS